MVLSASFVPSANLTSVSEIHVPIVITNDPKRGVSPRVDTDELANIDEIDKRHH